MKKVFFSLLLAVFTLSYAPQVLSINHNSMPLAFANQKHVQVASLLYFLKGAFDVFQDVHDIELVEHIPYDDWDLEVFPEGSPQVSLGADYGGGVFLQFHIGVHEDKESLVVEGMLPSTVSEKHPIVITFPDGAKKELTVEECIEYVFCTFLGDSSLISHFKKHPHATISYKDKEMGDITFDFSLRGFNKAYAAWDKALERYEQNNE